MFHSCALYFENLRNKLVRFIMSHSKSMTKKIGIIGIEIKRVDTSDYKGKELKVLHNNRNNAFGKFDTFITEL